MNNRQEECVFCKIIQRQIPAKVEYEDQDAIVIHDIRPKAPVHLLIIPKAHIPTVVDVAEDQLFLISHFHRIAQKLFKDLNLAGMRLINNCMEKGGQEVFHLHYHLLGWRAED